MGVSLRVSRSVLSLLSLPLMPLVAQAQTAGVEERLSKVESAAATDFTQDYAGEVAFGGAAGD